MANEKVLNTRIQLKYDSLAAWTSSNPELKPGEVAIAVVDTVAGSTLQPVMFKVGNANKDRFNDLDWASAKAADVYAWAKKSGIDVIDNGTGNVVSDISWDNASNSLVITRIDVYTKREADERFQPVGNYKTKQAEVANKITDKAHVLTTLTQNANGEISYNVKELTPEDIGAQPAGNYKTKQTAVNENGATTKTITNVSQNENGEVSVTYSDIAFPVVELPTVSEGAGIDVKKEGLNYTISHEDTSNVANVTAADRTYVKSLTFDDFGHVTGVTTGTETVVDTNTAHTHSVGAGLKQTGNGGIDGDVGYGLNVAFEIISKDGVKQISLYDKADNNKTPLALLDASDFIKEGMLSNVEYNPETNKLKFTWTITDANGEITTTSEEVTLSDIIDPYKEGALIDISNDNVISHERVAQPTAKGTTSSRTYITEVETDGYGHITGFKTNTENDQDLSNYKTKQNAVQDPTKDGTSQTNEFIASISQNENGEITATKKSINFSEYAKKIDLTNAIGDGVLTLAGNEGLEGNATFSANQKDASSFTVGIKDKGVTTDKIDDLAVDVTKLAIDSVVTAKIANKTVTKEKLADDVQASLEAADSAVQSVGTGLGLKNTGTAKDVVVDFDPDVVFVFNCGSATKVI